MVRLAMFGILCAAQLGCGSSRPIQADYYNRDLEAPLDNEQLIYRSSTIFVATVRAVTRGRAAVPARREPRLLLDEMFAEVDVENIIRGEPSLKRVTLSYFTLSEKNPGYTGPRYLRIEPGERRLFFLVVDSGQYRFVADFRDHYAVRVASGKHANCCKDDIESIARILLELGEGYNREMMARNLSQQAFSVLHLAGRLKTAPLLQALVANGHEPLIGAQACLILSTEYHGFDDCLDRFAAVPELPSDLKDDLSKRLASRAARRKELKRNLREHPLLALQLDSLWDVQQGLELLSNAPDSELGVLACAALRENYHNPPKRCL
jgi:hypothetical protein